MRPPAMLTDKLAVLHCLLAALATAIPSAATNCEGSHSVRLLWHVKDKEKDRRLKML